MLIFFTALFSYLIQLFCLKYSHFRGTHAATVFCKVLFLHSLFRQIDFYQKFFGAYFSLVQFFGKTFDLKGPTYTRENTVGIDKSLHGCTASLTTQNWLKSIML